jgi:hypothetical protein
LLPGLRAHISAVWANKAPCQKIRFGSRVVTPPQRRTLP